MTYQVFDCLSDTSITDCATKEEADDLCKRYGGDARCFYVFEKLAEKRGQCLLF
jgi:hypothetical protein